MEKFGFKKIGDDLYEGTRSFDIEEFKAEQKEDGFYISGYANTKNKPDSYGDIPHNLNGEPVYDFSRFKRNPVALVDHQNSIGNIFGVYTKFSEDEKGLAFNLRLMENPQTDIAKHAVESYKAGYARAFSIGGQWKFEDPKNRSHLTKAIIHEISGVAIGADMNALSHNEKPKSLEQVTEAEKRQLAIEALVFEYRKNPSKVVLDAIVILRGEK